MYYIALVNKENTILYPEHHKTSEEREKRQYSYETQAMNEVGGWEVYMGEEPFECVLARIDTVKGESEPQEDYEVRVGIAVQAALKSSTSKLAAPMIDDEPEWHKLGYQTLDEYEAHNPKG